MRKTLLVLLAIALAGFAAQASAKTNLGSSAPAVFQGNQISPDAGGPRPHHAVGHRLETQPVAARPATGHPGRAHQLTARPVRRAGP